MSKEFENASSCWKSLMSDISRVNEILPVIERFARENIEPSTIVFGTSGWRGEIGTDFTFNNVRIVTRAIVEMFKCNDKEVMDAMGVIDFNDIKRRGVIVGHDNRFLGPDFAMEIMGILQKEGIKTWYAGEATTPEFSSGIEMLNAACSINLTPSHNPANYAGFKFNPADGGPAGTEITSKIEGLANEIMSQRRVFLPEIPKYIDRIDLTELYIEFIKERRTLDLEKIKRFVDEEDCIICIDHVHGATRGRIQKIIGSNKKIQSLRTKDDYLFGGISPEPSEKNMESVIRILKGSNARFKIGAIMDPDGDRIRHADGQRQIPMNYFGAMAFHFLHKFKGIKGIVAKSVGTSNFVNAIAEKMAVPVRETKVGFKNFRPYLLRESKERAIVAFEESDGISGFNHTLEKDAIFGLLLSVEMVATLKKNLSDYLKELMDEFGYYYPDRSGITVDPFFIGEPLKKRLSKLIEFYKVGDKIKIGEKELKVKDILTVDGFKVVFDDSSWLMIRASGTEPKVRFYVESRSEADKKVLIDSAERITRQMLTSEL
jgi:phosphomannomutase